MAIRTKSYTINGTEFIRTYSDDFHYVVREGVEYVEANDPAEFGREYFEGRLIPEEERPEGPTAEEILNILLGGEEV